ncbi:hypothetical protein L596_013599 [Steinernema carpocapsae]|uniref:Uncharacterized protein n=1 Tax=Steinernema carpocapsae TaxID=34508 RepID=A0A4V6A547_STECR|nr:hypothetical protein L596_013599 [Steinernema carpocapsae]
MKPTHFLHFLFVPGLYRRSKRLPSAGPISSMISGYMYCAFCFRSCANIAIMGILNRDLKQHVRMIWKRFRKQSTVVFEITTNPSGHQSATGTGGKKLFSIR